MLKSGRSVVDYVDTAVRHVKLRQGALRWKNRQAQKNSLLTDGHAGVIGVKVIIMLPEDAGKPGAFPMADIVKVLDPKVEENNEPGN